MSDVNAVHVNPFEADVIAEPRAVRYSVPGLNDEPLQTLLDRFASLTRSELPRPPVRGVKAQLVVSPDAGYGKSHLLGRLFQKLGDRATQIYLRPFESAERAWSSILLATVQELERTGEHSDHGGTQLEAFAFGVLAHVAADFMADGAISDYESVKPAIDYLREHPLQVLGPACPYKPLNETLIKWLRARLDDSSDVIRLGALFRRRGVELDGREKAWLRVLAGYAFSPSASVERDAALTWLRGEPLEQDQEQSLKIRHADNDAAEDAMARQINDISLRRLRGLCMLSSYYRPFVFCFDQTESYGRTAELVDALGSCICELCDGIPNHLTIVTCNATNWLQELRPRMLPAYQARFSPPIDLQGIDHNQAKELLAQRLQEFQLGQRIIEFIAPSWLSSHFEAQPRIGVRYLLGRAAERFRRPSDATASPPRKVSVDAAFALEINKVRAKPALQQYSQDCLMWFSEWLVQGFDGVTVAKPARKYFSLGWEWPDRSVYFALEAGHNNARWRAIANEAMALASGARGAVRSIVFRTPDLKPIPGPNWVAARRTIDEAAAKGLRIINLTIDEVCELYAAREFYSNALQGNVDFAPTEVLGFLKERFAPWFKRYSRVQPSSHPPRRPLAGCDASVQKDAQANARASELTRAQIDILISHLRARRLVDIKEVLEKLGGERFKQALLQQVEKHPNLKAHAGAQTIVLQWRV